jgi:hypothetical protein
MDTPIKILTSFTPEEVDHIQWEDRLTIFRKYLWNIIRALHVNVIPDDFTPLEIESFKYKGEAFLLPKSFPLVEEQLNKAKGKIPMHKVSAIEYVEGLNMEKAKIGLEEEGIKMLPFFIAVYCRPEGERYDEKTVLNRAEEFKSLTMDVAWEVFFCTYKLGCSYRNDFLIYLNQVAQAEMKLQSKYRGFLTWGTRFGSWKLLSLVWPGALKRSKG